MSTILRTKREEMGVSLREMARRVGISAAYLSDIERERRTAPLDTQHAICTAYGVDAGSAFWPIAKWSYMAKRDCRQSIDTA